VKASQYDSVYFLGIGGIGMSALARWFHLQGMTVSGYDRTATWLTQQLIEEGMDIHFIDQVELIPTHVTIAGTLVIYTPAIPKDHLEFNFLINSGFKIIKRSEALGLIAQQHKTIAVAGTHGKTTTSALIAHILKTAGLNMVAFLGGVTTNYATNLVIEGKIGDDMLVIAEADEFDRSFLRLFPDVAVITAVDPDHLDIYGDHQSVIKSFSDFAGQIKPGGVLVRHASIECLEKPLNEITAYTYGMNQGQFFADRITTEGGFFEFNLVGLNSNIDHIKLGVPGFHNLENAIAASVVARTLGVDDATIRLALSSFQGVKRRFEFIINRKDIVFIDDYAHHPKEIEALLTSLRSMYPGKQITVIFQPHLYSRTRDFAAGFSESLSLADHVLLLDIYPARELPIAGVTSDMLMPWIKSPVKVRCTKAELLQKISDMNIEVLATVGAGDIDTCVLPIKESLNRKYNEN